MFYQLNTGEVINLKQISYIRSAIGDIQFGCIEIDGGGYIHFNGGEKLAVTETDYVLLRDYLLNNPIGK